MSNNLLKGKRGIIFGALNDMSIAWKVAERAQEEGATFTLTNAPIAMRMGAINDLAEKTNSEVIPADATSVEDLKHLFEKSQEILGGKVDFVLHSIGMSPNVRKKKQGKVKYTSRFKQIVLFFFNIRITSFYVNVGSEFPIYKYGINWVYF